MVLGSKEEAVVDIVRDREMYGLDIVKKSGGRLRRGTVYVTLSQMERKGLIEARSVPATHPGRGPARRLYRVTEQGMRSFLRRHSPLPMATVKFV